MGRKKGKGRRGGGYLHGPQRALGTALTTPTQTVQCGCLGDVPAGGVMVTVRVLDSGVVRCIGLA